MIKGKFRPKNPDKYKGNPLNIIYRSSWELAFLRELDVDENVEYYQSEEFSIPYFDRSRGHMGRYYPDFLVKYKNGTVHVIEIKPSYQCKPPKRGKSEKTFIKEALTYAKNASKWESAKRWCEQRGYQFRIMTEEHLGIPIRKEPTRK